MAQHAVQPMEHGVKQSNRAYMGAADIGHNYSPFNFQFKPRGVHLVHVPQHVNMNRPLKWKIAQRNLPDRVTSRIEPVVTVYPNNVDLSIPILLQNKWQTTYQNVPQMEEELSPSSNDIQEPKNKMTHGPLISTKGQNEGP